MASSKVSSAPERNLRFGVIGAGVMGRNHARVLSELPGVELVGVADPDAGRASQAAGQAEGAEVLADHKELIARKVDAVIVAAPTHLHHQISLELIDAGVALLVEKPIATTV